MTLYIVVADAAGARLLRRDGLGPVEEFEQLDHPEGRLHPGELEEGGSGQIHESTKTTARQSDPRTSTDDKYQGAFAQQVAERMKGLRLEGADGFVIAAAPRFLGKLRSRLDSATAGIVRNAVDKDFTGASVEEITEKLAK